ncbi:MAG: 23S rRNA (guanosine(2251)-2'-O)-methyltransferase RlmB [Pseudomonadota bacterium]
MSSPAESSQEFLSGIHPVREALKAGRRRITRLYMSKGRTQSRMESIVSLAQSRNIPVEMTDAGRLDDMTAGANHQGIAALSGPLPLGRSETVLKQVRELQGPVFILVIELLEDPHNLGALIRTAVCAGVDYIMIPRDRAASPTPAVSRASAGAMEHADLFVLANTAVFLRSLKDAGFWIAGLDAEGTTELFSSDLTGNLALVVGGEHKGIRPLVMKECDFLISLPITGVGSLNASVAGGIAMYEALRQRSGKK